MVTSRPWAQALSPVPDPRRRRGIRHRFTPLLVAAVAQCSPARARSPRSPDGSPTCPRRPRPRLALAGPVPAARPVETIDRRRRRVAARARILGPGPPASRSAAPGDVNRGTSSARRVVAVDGKAMRATLGGDDPVYLLAVLDHATSVVLAQVNVDARRTRSLASPPVLDQIDDLTGVVAPLTPSTCTGGSAPAGHGQGQGERLRNQSREVSL